MHAGQLINNYVLVSASFSQESSLVLAQLYSTRAAIFYGFKAKITEQNRIFIIHYFS
jgi:hypothetical protein